MKHIFVASDGSGGTAERALRAALAQFPQIPVEIELRPEVRTPQRVLEVVEEAASCGGLIVHTIVSRRLRQTMGEFGRIHNIRTVDLMGPLLAHLGEHFTDSPTELPGLFRELNREYFRRIEAMEFAFRHDDGLRSEELAHADIVLVGVSRTFKTPLSMFLAFKGWYVGNVPLILDLPCPPVLHRLEPGKVFGLATDAHHLTGIRKSRHDYLGGASGKYADFETVSRELAYANRVFMDHPRWRIVRVTNRSIEEIASEILAILRQDAASI